MVLRSSVGVRLSHRIGRYRCEPPAHKTTPGRVISMKLLALQEVGVRHIFLQVICSV
jgi:hypothetical protein